MAEHGAPRDGEGAGPPPAGPPGSSPGPGPDSTFYQPPPSDRQLRRSVLIMVATPLLIAAIPLLAAITRHAWGPLLAAVVLLLVLGVPRYFRVRALRRELAARRDGRPARDVTWQPRAPGLAYVLVLTILLVGATLTEFVVGAMRWGAHGSTNIGLGILGVAPSVALWVLVTVLRRRQGGPDT